VPDGIHPVFLTVVNPQTQRLIIFGPLSILVNRATVEGLKLTGVDWRTLPSIYAASDMILREHRVFGGLPADQDAVSRSR
jgi:hypothetical protein